MGEEKMNILKKSFCAYDSTLLLVAFVALLSIPTITLNNTGLYGSSFFTGSLEYSVEALRDTIKELYFAVLVRLTKDFFITTGIIISVLVTYIVSYQMEKGILRSYFIHMVPKDIWIIFSTLVPFLVVFISSIFSLLVSLSIVNGYNMTMMLKTLLSIDLIRSCLLRISLLVISAYIATLGISLGIRRFAFSLILSLGYIVFIGNYVVSIRYLERVLGILFFSIL
ncbi:MAG TPA: hypothetical protein ENI59_01220, partial [Euryarchaeota archaeon]|nr:hypothetical protein [Euryarchaeota archaeon]